MCDCGTCCHACGHDPGCSALDSEPLPGLEAVVADPRPGSFLDWMLAPAAEATPAEDDSDSDWELPELHESTYHVNRHREFPYGCRWCGELKRSHPLDKWTPVADGYHQWTEPTQGQIKARMHARRAARKRVAA